METRKNKKIQVTQFTIQEIWQAMRGNVYKSKKQYTRKDKHKGKNKDYWQSFCKIIAKKFFYVNYFVYIYTVINNKETMYSIIYQSAHTREVIDTAETMQEAKQLQSDYQMAFKTDFIYIQ